MKNTARLSAMIAMAASVNPDLFGDVTTFKSKSNFDKPEDRADCRTDSKAAKRRRKQAERNKK